jgi:hypothetical protein
MRAKTQLLFSVLLICLSGNLYAQDNEFCNAINTISADAPNKFRNIRGNVTGDNPNATMWSCEVKVPGTINSRFVASQGLFYEGALYQSKNNNELQRVYDKYKEQLNACLSAQGYTMSLSPNFMPGLGEFKKLVFIREPKEDIKPENAPAHVAMETLYSKEMGLYTIVLYVFEH